MIPFFGITEVELAAWRSAMGIPAEAAQSIPPLIVNCEVCETPVDFGEQYIEAEPAPPGQRKRYFHIECLTTHLIRNEDNPSDEITSFILRKPICQPETQTSSVPNVNGIETIDDSTPFDI